MNKNYKILVLLIVALFLIDCSSPNKLVKKAKHLNCGKPIEFIYDRQSDIVKLELIEQVHGDYRIPNYESEFRYVISEFDKNISSDIKVNNGFGFQHDSIIYVNTRIERIIMTFGDLKTTLETDINFKVKNNEIRITGIHSGHWEISTNVMFRKTLIDAVHQFLQMNCDY